MHEILDVPVWLSIPFILMLLSIALAPIFADHWWSKNKNKLITSLLLSIPVIIYMLSYSLSEKLFETLVFDYVPFMILLGSLFIITGGIHLSGDIKAIPLNNTIFLGIGYLLASIMGTTGAAMLLIRPVISTNQERRHTTHTILFFIGAVANCGGLLTPLGDPPLFMLYLRGVEFTWFLHLLPEWGLTGILLLSIYYFTDRHYYNKEEWVDIAEDMIHIEPIKITGKINFIYLALVVATVAFVNKSLIPAMGNEESNFAVKYLRELILIGISIIAYISTPKSTFEKNKFSWEPIAEVAFLFLGIFITMSPSLIYLANHATELGITKPTHFLYASGTLSSFLDNTPTAVAFYDLAKGLVANGLPTTLANSNFVAGIPEILLKSICVGAVFFGAMTYIGNGPNLRVKSSAQENNITMPDFFGYIYKFSFNVLLPIYILIQLIFI
ncbi:MAG: hypothetical protein RIS29_1673 [Bacteroidota bacterium]